MDRRYPEWFEVARLGMFLHFGPFSVAGLEPSWPMVGGIPQVLPLCQSMTVEEYDAATAGFSPREGAPLEWARLAADCQMDYAVLTTKHHDGFCLWPSKHTRHGIAQTAPGRDVVGEYVEAMRAAEILVGFYFSLPDWHHPAYPAWRDDMRPYPALGYPRPSPEDWQRFIADQRGQLDELLTHYGPIDLLWFDGGWERTAEEWDSAGLEEFIRDRQPDIVINDRCPGLQGYSSAMQEGTVPLQVPAGPWEACIPLDDSWGPLDESIDSGRKSVAEVVTLVAEGAAGGGRLLLNVSPLGDGSVPGWQRDRLEGLASWLSHSGSAVVGSRPAPDLRGGHHYGPVSTSPDGSNAWLVCPGRPSETVVLRSVRVRSVTAARALATGTPLETRLRISAVERMLNIGNPVGDLVITVPPSETDEVATVIELDLSAPLT